MMLTSSAFQHMGFIPRQYTCDGANLNPPLDITAVPEGTQSLVLIMDDPDVPLYIRPDGMWDHWVVFNIPPTTATITAGKEPQGVHGVGTGNNTKYYGPCPPEGEHRYCFKLYALDTLLTLAEKATRHEVEHAMQAHILAKAELTGIYGRS
jgi:Raf kinase inhibitor-like YbhB/YbcL family protein